MPAAEPDDICRPAVIRVVGFRGWVAALLARLGLDYPEFDRCPESALCPNFFRVRRTPFRLRRGLLCFLIAHHSVPPMPASSQMTRAMCSVRPNRAPRTAAATSVALHVEVG